MNKLYLTNREDLYLRLDEVLISVLGKKPDILRTRNGKPYISGNPVYFSLSHSGNKGAIAVCDLPVGVDIELLKGKTHRLLLSRFSEREQSEIISERDFLIHWTAREAFVKMRGEKLFDNLKTMEYCGGKMYLDGIYQPCFFKSHIISGGVVTICLGEKL